MSSEPPSAVEGEESGGGVFCGAFVGAFCGGFVGETRQRREKGSVSLFGSSNGTEGEPLLF